MKRMFLLCSVIFPLSISPGYGMGGAWDAWDTGGPRDGAKPLTLSPAPKEMTAGDSAGKAPTVNQQQINETATAASNAMNKFGAQSDAAQKAQDALNKVLLQQNQVTAEELAEQKQAQQIQQQLKAFQQQLNALKQQIQQQQRTMSTLNNNPKIAGVQTAQQEIIKIQGQQAAIQNAINEINEAAQRRALFKELPGIEAEKTSNAVPSATQHAPVFQPSPPFPSNLPNPQYIHLPSDLKEFDPLRSDPQSSLTAPVSSAPVTRVTRVPANKMKIDAETREKLARKAQEVDKSIQKYEKEIARNQEYLYNLDKLIKSGEAEDGSLDSLLSDPALYQKNIANFQWQLEQLKNLRESYESFLNP